MMKLVKGKLLLLLPKAWAETMPWEGEKHTEGLLEHLALPPTLVAQLLLFLTAVSCQCENHKLKPKLFLIFTQWILIVDFI